MQLSLPLFLEGLSRDPIAALAVILTLGVMLVNGWTDAPNAIATCISTRCLSVRAAIALAAIFNFLGVFIMTRLNATVAFKITQMVNFSGADASKQSFVALSAAMLAVVLWAVLAWLFGIPSSESHALIAGLTGSAIALHGGFAGVSGREWASVLYGIIISVGLGFAFGYLACKTVVWLFRHTNRMNSVSFFKSAQILGAAAMSFMHGAQDGQKLMGVLLLCLSLSGLSPATDAVMAPTWMLLLCSTVMCAGTAMGGKRIIRSVGMDMVRLEKHQGFSADVAAAVTLLTCSLTGLPVSTTHTKTAAILGVGITKSSRNVDLGVVKQMALTWAFTFPGCGLLSFAVTKVLMLVL